LGSGLGKFSASVRCVTCENMDLAISTHANAVDNVFNNELNCFRRFNCGPSQKIMTQEVKFHIINSVFSATKTCCQDLEPSYASNTYCEKFM